VATKIAASVIRRPGAAPDPLHRWIIQSGDIRDDRSVSEEVAAFFRRHGVRQISTLRQVIGCPHEEGKDYPLGGKCPHCPYWHDRDRFTLDLLPASGMSAAEILAELSKPNPTRQPIEAITVADLHRDELIEPLLRALERGVANPQGSSSGQAMLFSFACFLLAKWREPRAYPLFIRWFSLPGEGAFDIGGSTVTEAGKRLLASVCGRDLEPLKQVVLNPEANEYCRAEAIETLGLLAAWEEVPYREVVEYFLWLAREGLERESTHVWNGLAAVCVDIEAFEVFPALRQAYVDGLIDPDFMREDELDEIEQGPHGGNLARYRAVPPRIDDVVEETKWLCFQTLATEDEVAVKPLPVTEDPATKGRVISAGGQYRASPKVGRNDPCPCGSGKKYKHCCGK
jgi:Protein of unknown function (DUF1186)/SEC-C motif